MGGYKGILKEREGMGERKTMQEERGWEGVKQEEEGKK